MPLPTKPKNAWETLKLLLPFVWEFRGRVIIAAICLILAKLANVGVPLVLKEIIDALDQSQQQLLFLPVALLVTYGVLRLTSALFSELRDGVFAKVTQRAIRRISLQVFEHLHTLSLRFHLQRQTGGLSRDIERGTKGISFLLTFTLFNIIPTLAEVALIAIILLMLYSPWYAFITFVTVAIYIAFTLLVTEWRLHFRRQMNSLESEANTRAIDSLLNYETVKYFGNERFEAQRYDDNLSEWEGAAVKNQTSLAALNFGQAIIIACGMTALLFLASKGVVSGNMSLGDLVLINAYLLQLFIPMNFLGFVYREIRHSLADMERMFTLLDQGVEVVDKENAKDLLVTGGRIDFKHVSFAYENERQILHDIDFSIPAGHKVAVVGVSGGGKSTLVRLLFRFYDVSAGSIEIDGMDIRQISQHSLRQAIGIVPQDTVLFHDTIYYNISYAKPGAEEHEIIAAAKTAHIHDFIVSLPQGYQTQVGERGLKLSGGEKQRIAIARTILKNPRILIFDEATSALDSNSEAMILQALRELASQHTTLVIAHRLSTIVDADQILVLEAGKIVERGSHQQLLEQQGHYAGLWQMQQATEHLTATENKK